MNTLSTRRIQFQATIAAQVVPVRMLIKSLHRLTLEITRITEQLIQSKFLLQMSKIKFNCQINF